MSQEEIGNAASSENLDLNSNKSINFTLEEDQKTDKDNSTEKIFGKECPFCQISASDLKKLIRPPFRKRHPFIFWGFTICITLFILSLFFDGEDTTERIALVNIEGPILDSAADIKWINTVAQTSHVKGILARINSPGGGAAASQEIY